MLDSVRELFFLQKTWRGFVIPRRSIFWSRLKFKSKMHRATFSLHSAPLTINLQHTYSSNNNNNNKIKTREQNRLIQLFLSVIWLIKILFVLGGVFLFFAFVNIGSFYWQRKQNIFLKYVIMLLIKETSQHKISQELRFIFYHNLTQS